ncbi:unannotated protein [freshwater metagenome]|uniref:Unannotated protein n=1 Tax=freshwater metagenome TaxID=449393 RepID=A0A6J7K3S6_9ZZZZ
MRRGALPTLLLVCAVSLSFSACRASGTEDAVPSTSFAPLSVPSTPPSTLPENGPSTVPTTRPGSSLQTILDTTVVASNRDCIDGEGSIRVSHPVLDPPPEGLLTAIIDGQQVSERLSERGSGFALPGIRCDGVVHTVLLVVTNPTGQTQTRAVAVLMS